MLRDITNPTYMMHLLAINHFYLSGGASGDNVASKWEVFWQGIQALSERSHFSVGILLDKLFPTALSVDEPKEAGKLALALELLAGSGLRIGWDGSNRVTVCGSNGVADTGIVFEYVE